MTLGKALAIAEDPATGLAYWWGPREPSCRRCCCLLHVSRGVLTAPDHPCPPAGRRFLLAKRRAGDAVGGELCLGFELLDAIDYAQARARRNAIALLCF